MKIVIVHNKYPQRGGEDVVVDAEAKLLTEHGFEVVTHIIPFPEPPNSLKKLQGLISLPFNKHASEWMSSVVLAERPDVVHFHNITPLPSPSAHKAAFDHGVGVVQTLHNYRITCSSAKLLRDGAYCDKCVSGSKIWGAIHRCAGGSLLRSAALVAMQERARLTNHWANHIDTFITLNARSTQIFSRAGVPLEKLVVKPNFTPVQAPSSTNRLGALFVGRLSPEKGLATALKAFRSLPEINLAVIGTGPEFDTLRASASNNVTFLGERSAAEVASAMASAEMLIMPSIWNETFGLTVIEAFAAGLPVICSDMETLKELVVDGETGLLFQRGSPDSLVEAVRRIRASPRLAEDIRTRALIAHATRYSPSANVAILREIYERASAEGRNRRSVHHY